MVIKLIAESQNVIKEMQIQHLQLQQQIFHIRFSALVHNYTFEYQTRTT